MSSENKNKIYKQYWQCLPASHNNLTVCVGLWTDSTDVNQ